jgi:hypothetical protein
LGKNKKRGGGGVKKHTHKKKNETFFYTSRFFLGSVAFLKELCTNVSLFFHFHFQPHFFSIWKKGSLRRHCGRRGKKNGSGGLLLPSFSRSKFQGTVSPTQR